MPRFNKWLPFFEQTSEQRDVASWDKVLQEHLADKNIRVTGLVTDRAKALVKLGESDYLNVSSMPDFFHFQQDMGKLAGLQIGRKYKQAQQSKSDIGEKTKLEERQAIQSSAKETSAVYQEYLSYSRTNNKTIHPFDASNNWSSAEQVNKTLVQSVIQVSKLADKIDLTIDLSKANKILRQIPDIVTGISNWINRSQQTINEWVDKKIISEVEKIWFTGHLLPLLYWQAQLSRTKNSRSNPQLVAYYQERIQQTQAATITQMNELNIPIARQDILFEMAYQMANSFQRASSQVEGRNGYLAFIHHSQKGIPEKKRKALTVIHNFDTKREDGSTPAQRLFKQDFPDLFEFLCSNVTGFKEPRKRKANTLKTNLLQR